MLHDVEKNLFTSWFDKTVKGGAVMYKSIQIKNKNNVGIQIYNRISVTV